MVILLDFIREKNTRLIIKDMYTGSDIYIYIYILTTVNYIIFIILFIFIIYIYLFIIHFNIIVFIHILEYRSFLYYCV